jgi:hypothetical protein
MRIRHKNDLGGCFAMNPEHFIKLVQAQDRPVACFYYCYLASSIALTSAISSWFPRKRKTSSTKYSTPMAITSSMRTRSWGDWP